MTTPSTAPGCCGSGRAPTVSDYVDRGIRRSRLTEPATLAPACADEAGRIVRFGVDIDEGVVTRVGFRASSCVTLIAYCEVAAQRISGQRLADAWRRLHPTDLAQALPSVPFIRRDRAHLAARALLTALLEKAKDGQP